jgi:transposase-like protein
MSDADAVPRQIDRPVGDPPLIDDRLADELLARARAQGAELLGPKGPLSQVTKAVLERALGEEMTEHLGCEKHDPAGRGSGNCRNGSTPKRGARWRGSTVGRLADSSLRTNRFAARPLTAVGRAEIVDM